MKIIKKISIQSFRSIFEWSSEGLGDLNLFFGGNDSGKSNVLKSLNLFFNGQTSFLEEFNFKKDYSKAKLKYVREQSKGKQCIRIRVTFDHNLLLKSKKKALRDLINKNGKNGLWIERTWWGYDPRDYQQKLPKYLENASQGIKRSLTVLLDSIKYVYVPAFKDVSVFSAILGKLGQEEIRGFKFEEIDKLNVAILSATEELSRDFKNVTDISTTLSLPSTLQAFWAGISVNSYLDGIGGEKDFLIDFIQRGEGIKSIYIPILLNWVSHNTTKNWIWGIDEPENSLEQNKVQDIFNKFLVYSKERNQIFVSTHSPIFCFPNREQDISVEIVSLLTQQESPGKTTFINVNDFDSNKEKLIEQFGVSYIKFLSLQEEISRQYRDLSKLQEENDRLNTTLLGLDAKPVLFVEGKTDKTILENAWRKLRPNVQMPVNIVNAFDRGFIRNLFSRGEIFTNNPHKKFIGLFDFDDGLEDWTTLKNTNCYTQIETNISRCLTIRHSNNRGYLLMLPVPGFRSDYASINQLNSYLSIELLFQDEKVLQFCNDIIITNSLSLKKFRESSKVDFSTNTGNFIADDFSEFNFLIEKIEDIISVNNP